MRWGARAPTGLACLLLAGGIAALPLAARRASPSRGVAGDDVPVDVARATDPLQVATANSPTVVRNPRDPLNLAIVNRVDSPTFSCSVHVSADGGTTWAETPLPALPRPAAVPCFGPDAAFGPDGTLYVSFTSAAPVDGRVASPDAVWVASSRDGGRTIDRPVAAAPPLALQVRIAADPDTPGRVHLTWLQATATGPWGLVGGGRILTARSDDGGSTWASPVVVSPPRRTMVAAPTVVATAPNHLLVAYLDVGDDRLDYAGAHEGRGGPPHPRPWSLVLARSTDDGLTWAESVVDDGVVPTQRFLQLFAPTPSLVADGQSHRVYAAFHDGRLGDADVFVWSSPDAGNRWSGARLVNDARPGDQYSPALALSPGGRLDVLYYDRRADPANVMTEVSLQSSFDHGRTFGARVPLSSASFDSRIGFGSERGLAETGSRLGLLATSAGSLAVWADSRAASAALTRQDLVRAVVTFPTTPLWRAPLGAGGLAAVVGAIAVLAVRAGAPRLARQRGELRHRGR